MGKQMPRADYRYTFYPERKVEDQEAHFAMAEQRVSLRTRSSTARCDSTPVSGSTSGMSGSRSPAATRSNRSYFEGEGYSDRNENRIDVDAAPFIVGKLSLRF